MRDGELIADYVYINSRPITLTVAVDENLDGTLTGVAEGITVNGDINAVNLSGEVIVSEPTIWRSDITADLQGFASHEKTVGIFHGASADSVVAGGFFGREPNP